MYNATKDIILPTTITGSLPRPNWFTDNMGTKSFLEAMMESRYREQYTDTVSTYLREQETAGLDICTDGDAHYDEQVGGQSWTSYPLFHMDGFDRRNPALSRMQTGGVDWPMGHILHDYLEARVMPRIVGPVGRGRPAVHRDVEDGPTPDDQTSEVRHHRARLARHGRSR